MNSGKHLLLRYCAMGLVVVWLGTCIGCDTGSATAEVEGTVTFDDQPVDGSIVLEPADGAGPSAGGTIEQGKYRLSGEGGVVPGKKTVRITAVRKTGRKHDASMPGATGKGPSGGETLVDEMEQYIPAIYNEKSTLTCEVVAGKTNQHNFELKSE